MGGLRVFVRIRISGISFHRLAFFAIKGNPAKPNTDKRLSVEDARCENPENPIIP